MIEFLYAMQLLELGIIKDWLLVQLVSAEIPPLFAGTAIELQF